MKTKILIILFFILVLSGCEQVIYDSMHGNQKIRCHAIPNAEDRLNCEQQHSVPYENYQRSLK